MSTIEIESLEESVVRVDGLRASLLLGEVGENLPPQSEQHFLRALASLEAAKCDLNLALFNLRRAT